MRTILFSLLLCCSITETAIAATISSHSSEAQTNVTILKEISDRSGLSSNEVKTLLNNCDANQQSMYFCAWRDQLLAENSFKRVFEEKARKYPQCKSKLASKITAWEQRRNLSCDKASKQQWGEGSMGPMAKVLCITKETVRMTKKLESSHNCK